MTIIQRQLICIHLFADVQRKLTVNYNRTIAIAQYPVIYFVAVTTMSIDAVVIISISIVAALSDRTGRLS